MTFRWDIECTQWLGLQINKQRRKTVSVSSMVSQDC